MKTARFLKPTAEVHIIQLRALLRCHAAPPSGHKNTVLIHLEPDSVRYILSYIQ